MGCDNMITSMLFYLIVFVVCIIGFYISEHLVKKQQKFSTIFAFMSILIISLVAGLRGEDVGVDVKVYIINYCQIAQYMKKLSDVLNSSMLNIGGEIGFGLLLYICTRFKYSVQLILFFIQLLTVYPIYKACTLIKTKHEKFSITLGMATYLFLYFNNTLNNMRQSVAIAFMILGMSLITVNKKKIKNYIPFIIAIFFHKSSLIGIMLLAIIKYLYYNKKKMKKLPIFILNISIISIPLLIQSLYNLAVRLGLSNDHFDYYADVFIFRSIEKNWFTEPFSLYSLAFVLFIILFSLVLIFGKEKYKDENDNSDENFYTNIVLYGYLIYLIVLFSFKTMYGIRISIMLDMFNIIALPLTISHSKYKISKIILVTLLILCWFILIIKLGWSGSHVYSFFKY